MRLIYHLQGLDCASCAAKIETAATKIENINKAVVDFSSSRIIITSKQTVEQSKIKTALQEIVSAVEPGVIVAETLPTQEKTTLVTTRNITFGLGMIAYLTAWILPTGLWKNALFLMSYALTGYEIVVQALHNIQRGLIFDENFLMSIATLGALAIRELPEAATVMLFYRTGEFLQSLAVDRSRRSISALIAVRPELAHRKEENNITDIPVEEVRIGDELLIYPGERIPVDGIVMEGLSALNTSALTGESVPRSVSKGENVLAGSINLSGLLTLNARKLAADSAVSRILDLVENATANKAPTEDLITSLARYYTPAVVGIALLIATIPPLLIGGEFSNWFYRALVFLVISCPCALVVSIPLSFFGGIGRASRQGVLIKGSNYLQALHEAKTIVFDKTGTLTSGKFSVTRIEANAPFSQAKLLKIAAHAEAFSSHPLAQSIIQAYGQDIQQSEIHDVEEFPGLGVRARWVNQRILVGSSRFLEQNGIKIISSADSTIHVGVDGVYAGRIILSDQPKKGAQEAVSKLMAKGKRLIMLTGDNWETATQIGRELGIREIQAELLPHQKAQELEKIIKNSAPGKVIFVGDGINDAPALARAHVGVAMGALGSEAAIESADVVLMTDEPRSFVDALETAHRTNKIVWQNIALTFGVKVIVLMLGALGIATLWEAVFADVGVTILAVLNSLRIITPEKTSRKRIL